MSKPNSQFYSLIGLFIVILIDTMGFGIIFPVISPLFLNTSSTMVPTNTSLSFRDLYYGLTLGIFSVFMFFAGPILGDLSDQLGRKKVILFCLFGSAISSVICALGITF